MRTAILLSGHMRTYKRCCQSLIERIAEPLDADIFISTWDSTGFSSVKRRYHRQDRSDNTIVPDDLLKTYGERLKSLSIENQQLLQNAFNRKNNVNEHTGQPNYVYRAWNTHISSIIPRFYSMCYKIKSCNELRKIYETNNGIKYDLIIRSRPDLLIRSFTLEGCNLSLNQWHIPSCESYRGWNDQFALGNNEVMNQYCDVYDSIDKYIAENREYSQWVEGVFERHAREAKVKKYTCPKIIYTLER